jgi:zinc transport system ATP-binding protein
MHDSSALLTVRAASVSVGGFSVLQKVDLTVERSEIVSLIGPNGSGKTTLVRLALGLIDPDQGIASRVPGIVIGYVPQLFSVDETLPLTTARLLSMAGGDRAQVEEALAEVGAAHLIRRPIQGLSVGETKRILLARALLRSPDLLVLDEPAAGVDMGGQAEFYGLLGKIRDRTGCGILLISHDLHFVMAATDKVVCLNHHVCCTGAPDAVTRHPEYIALFGPEMATGLAVYAHEHDHHHDISGEAVADDGAENVTDKSGAHNHG